MLSTAFSNSNILL